jgi:two-component system sensor histidine kinase BaeS
MTTMAHRIAIGTVASALVAVSLSSVVALGMVRHAYDGQARAVLHREAVLAAQAQESRPALAGPRALRAVGVLVIRVHADGRVQAAGAAAQLAAADRATLAAGAALSGDRQINGHRYLIEAQPVSGDGGVALLQRASEAGAITRTVARRLLLAALVGLAASALIGLAVARRLSRPVVEAAAAAHRIATGDRAVSVPEQGPVEVAELGRGLNSLTTALATSEGRERAFLLSVSHELRTPLTAIRGFAEAVADGVAPDPAAAARTIDAEAERLQRLVADLLDLARVGADDFRVQPAPVDLAALVADAAVVWRQRCAAVGVDFVADLPERSVVVQTDAGRVRQVLDGLAENALRVTPAGQAIVFAVGSQPKTGGTFEVRDGGPGLREEDLAVAFDRGVLYERYRGVRQVGTGLGLALVGALVARLGGRAEAGHAPEGGARFVVTLPG